MTRVSTHSRTWRYPDLRNGSTIHMLTDTHYKSVDWPTFAQNWTERMEADVEFLKIATNRGHVHTGDMINWHELTPGGEFGTDAVRVEEETRYLTFRDAVQSNDGLPWAEAAGNHDLVGVSLTGTPDGERVPRTSEQWATDVGLDSPLQAVDFGDMRVLAFAPETWGDLPDATMDWLEEQLSATTKPCFLAYHLPLAEQYGPDGPGDGSAIDNHNARILDIVGAHTNLVGWLSGHYHINVQQPSIQQPHASVINVEGRNIFVINGPSATNMANTDTRFTNGKPCASMYLTLLDENTLDVRWRNHSTRSWMSSVPGESHRLLSRA